MYKYRDYNPILCITQSANRWYQHLTNLTPNSHIIQSYNVYVNISTNMRKYPCQLQPIFIWDILPTQINFHINALPNIQLMTNPYQSIDQWLSPNLQRDSCGVGNISYGHWSTFGTNIYRKRLDVCRVLNVSNWRDIW